MDRVTAGITIESTALTPEQISQRLGIAWDDVQRLTPIAKTLREISATEGGEFFIHVHAQSMPGINLSADTLHALATAELSLDVDIILYAPEEG